MAGRIKNTYQYLWDFWDSNWRLVIGILITLLLAVYLRGFRYQNLGSCYGHPAISIIGMFLWLPSLVVPGLAVLLLPIRFFSPISRRHKVSRWLAWCLCLAVSMITIGVSEGIRRDIALNTIVNSAEPILGALAKYKEQNAIYPVSLTTLVPTYLKSIPATGLCAYPDFIYKMEFNPSDYELAVNMSDGMPNWDRFVYWPSEKYPDDMQGGYVDRFRKWAYVNE